jgi:hypothetical protein
VLRVFLGVDAATVDQEGRVYLPATPSGRVEHSHDGVASELAATCLSHEAQ